MHGFRFAAGTKGEPREKTQVDAVLEALAEEDPWNLIVHSEQLGPAREAGLCAAVSKLARREPARAFDWLSGLPPGRERDHIVDSAVNFGTIEYDPARALAAAALIQDPDLRDTNLSVVFDVWYRNSPDDAIAALSRTRMDDSRRQAILDNVTTGW